MHPRNKYKTPPNFTDLALAYPELLCVSTLDLNGSVKLNFQNPRTLQILTRCLLHRDFNLDVEIPDNRLVPTVPLRLNYLLWIQDLLDANDFKTDIIGIDIGTGCCCIYPLLAAVEFKWKMKGTESNEQNVVTALENVQRNDLGNLITIKKVSSDSSILQHCFEGDEKLINAHFCMCNPPFYSSIDDMNIGRTPSRPPPKNAHTGTFEEIITPGGEVAFVKKMIDESIILENKIFIYTTMLGHKSSLKPLLHYLIDKDIKNSSQTQFHQGRTTRWGLAWSFNKDINLTIDSSKSSKHGKPMSFVIPPIANLTYDVENVAVKVIEILNSINVKYKTVQKKDVIRTMEIKASKNTWSHQRRKRRLEKSQQRVSSVITKSESIQSDDNHETLDCEPSQKKAKISVDENGIDSEVNSSSPQTSISSPPPSSSIVEDFITAAVCIRKYDDSVMLEIGYVSGTGGKDSVHQIIQYIKNNWK